MYLRCEELDEVLECPAPGIVHHLVVPLLEQLDGGEPSHLHQHVHQISVGKNS